MMAEKKRLGTKAQVRALKERERRIGVAIFLISILLIIILSTYFIYTFPSPGQRENEAVNPLPFQLKAAIVDQASLSPAGGYSESFVKNVTETLKNEGYAVDYYAGEQVTVDFFRNLPRQNYTLIILRTHSTTATQQGEKLVEGYLVIFTSEPYSQGKYVYEQLADRVGAVSYSALPPYYFAITQSFVLQSMNGNFHDTTIIMTGCDGLKNKMMAAAFIQKGAKVCIGWDKSIFFSHTDIATVYLLQHLLVGKQTIKQSVDNTMKEVGPDPVENSTLEYYPTKAGDQTIENVN